MDTHTHPTGPAQDTISAALQLIAVLDAEQKLAQAMEPLYRQLRDSDQGPAADRLSQVQSELRAALVDAGKLVDEKLRAMAGSAQPGQEV